MITNEPGQHLGADVIQAGAAESRHATVNAPSDPLAFTGGSMAGHDRISAPQTAVVCEYGPTERVGVVADTSAIAQSVAAKTGETISIVDNGGVSANTTIPGPGVKKARTSDRPPKATAVSNNGHMDKRALVGTYAGSDTVHDVTPDSGDGGSGGGGGDDGKNKPPSGEHKLEIMPIPEELKAVVKELKERGYTSIAEVPLLNHERAQLEFRRQFWDEDLQRDIRRLQLSKETLNADDPQSWYELRKYRGGRITVDNTKQVLGFSDVFDMLYDEKGNPKNILEIGPGNGDLIRGIQKAKDKLEAYADMIRSTGQRKENGRRSVSLKAIQREVMQRAKDVDLSAMDTSLMAIDFVRGFCRSLQKLNIAAFPGDICASPDQLIGKHKLEKAEKTGQEVELKPHSVDLFIMNFVGDRVEDIQTAVANIRRLARIAEGENRSRFMMGGSYPFSSVSDSDSKSENIPAVKFWDESHDMRKRWTGDPKDPNARKMAVVNAVLDLSRVGLVVDRIAVQKTYEAYSPHCIIEPARDLQAKYSLEELMDKYEGTDYEQVIKDVFAGKIANDEIIPLPQIYKEVYLFGGYVRSLDDDGNEPRASKAA